MMDDANKHVHYERYECQHCSIGKAAESSSEDTNSSRVEPKTTYSGLHIFISGFCESNEWGKNYKLQRLETRSEVKEA